ncbi:MAG: ImmA/IrrE family metallo-endopeptidase [Lachnospiraceae bacterium]|nr:ImmA/IrrE family metallo-endopeptidase [Lachnospiraceae bacterium]
MPNNFTRKTNEDRMKEITERLEKGVAELFTSENYKTYLKTMSKFHNYSFNNTILIAAQKPDATRLAGFDAWQRKFHRSVKKGEHGIRIIAPITTKERRLVGRINPETKEAILDEEGKQILDDVSVEATRFRMTTVFDVSQTEGEPLPTLGADELMGNVAYYDTFIEAVKDVSPVPIRFDDIDIDGYYQREDKEIVIKNGMSEVQTMETIIHEMAHSILHSKEELEDKEVKKDRLTREVEAESVAYTVSQHFGFDTSEMSFGYIAGWSSGREMKELKSSMDLIRKTSADIIDKITEKVIELENEKPLLDNPYFEIYQRSNTTENRSVEFQPLSKLRERNLTVLKDNFDKVYTGELTEGVTLDSIYDMFTSGEVEGQDFRSILTGDVIVLNRNGRERAFFVDDSGFMEIPEFYGEKEAANENVVEMPKKTKTKGKIKEDKIASASAMDVYDYEGFINMVSMALPRLLPDIYSKSEIKVMDINKMQNVHEKAISILPPNSITGPILYMREYFNMLERGAYLPVVLDRIKADAVHHIENVPFSLSQEDLLDYEKVKSSLGIRVLNTKVNEEYLKDIPHTEIEDLSVIYTIRVAKDADGISSAVVKDNLFNEWGVDLSTLHEDAVKNMVKMEPAKLMPLRDLLVNMMGEEKYSETYVCQEDKNLYWAGVESNIHGASLIAYPDFLENASKEIGDNLYVIPSSIHEILLVPERFFESYKDLEYMVRDVNEAVVSPMDFLSDKVYHYDKENHVFELASKYEDRINGVSKEVMFYNSLDDKEKKELASTTAYAVAEYRSYHFGELSGIGERDAYVEKITNDLISGSKYDVVGMFDEIIAHPEKYKEEAVNGAIGMRSMIEKSNGISESVSYYVAESSEFPSLGEYHEGLTLPEAIKIYNDIPGDRLNAKKTIGITFLDGSIYDGTYDLMPMGFVSDDVINMVDHIKASPEVKKAYEDLKEAMPKEKDLSATKEEIKKKSVVKDLKDKKESVSKSNTNKSKTKSKSNKKDKGGEEL